MIHLKVVTRVFLFKKFFSTLQGKKFFLTGVSFIHSSCSSRVLFNLKGATILIFQDSANGISINDLREVQSHNII